MHKKTIGVLVGSARCESFNKKIADVACELMPEEFTVKTIEISKLPLFNQDYDEDGMTPAEWVTFRAAVETLDGFLFVTPEYNRSVPALLKNALDIASRPYGQNRWNAKPGAVISVSTGAMGGFGSNHHLRQTLSFLNVYTMGQPEAYISNAAALFDANGALAENTRNFLQSYVNAFAAWVNRF